MNAGGNIRMERIERLLSELEYEITRGIMEREIEPHFGARFHIPGGPTGTVLVEYRARPMPEGSYMIDDPRGPRLRVVETKGDGNA